MNGISASLGLSQLKKLNKILKLKRSIHKYYTKVFLYTKFSIIQSKDYSISNHWLNILLIKDQNILKKKNNFLKYLNLKNIQARPLWKLNHKQKPFVKFESYKIAKSIDYYNACICLPSSPNLTKRQIDYIKQTIVEY